MVSILLGSFILLKQRNYNFFLIQLFCQNTIASKSEFWRIYKASIWFSAIGIPCKFKLVFNKAPVLVIFLKDFIKS